MTWCTFWLLNGLITSPITAFALKNRHFHTSAFYQCIGERHFVSHSKRKTMKGNVLPKLPSQVDFCLEREKCKKKDLFDSVWTVYHFATYL